MLDEIRQRIEDEIEALTTELNVELPKRIQEALELGDLRENAEHKSAIERQQFVQARISHLMTRVSDLSKIDLSAMPYDRVGFGSKVTVPGPESFRHSTDRLPPTGRPSSLAVPESVADSF